MTDVVVRGDLVGGVIAGCTAAGVRPPTSSEVATGTMVRATSTITWTPDLTTQELATVNSVVKLALGSTLITKAERDAIDSDIVTLRAFFQNATPTNAQSVAAIKSIINVLRVMLRD